MYRLQEISTLDPLCSLLGPGASSLNIYSIILRLFISLVLSFAIGCERSSKRHSAGLRTFILVSLSGTVSAILDEALSSSLPLIVAAGVIAVALISVNSLVLSSKSILKGLTTSTLLFSVFFLGLSSGFALYSLTLIFFLFIYVTASLFPPFERFLKNRSNHFEVHLELESSRKLEDFVTVCRELGLRIDDIENNPAYRGSGLSVYTITLTILSKELKAFKTHVEIIKALSTLEYIHHIEEII